MASDPQVIITGDDPSKGVISKRQRVVATVVAATLIVVVGLVWLWSSARVPNEKTMARIMADVYTADALLQDYVPKGKDDKLVDDTYHTVFAHYGITKAEYDSAIAYYSVDPRRFTGVYERCVDILSQREVFFKTFVEGRDSIERAVQHQNDSLKRYFGRMPLYVKVPLAERDTMRRHVVYEDKVAKSFKVSFPIDSMVGGKMNFCEKYTFARDNKVDSAFVRMVVVYADSTADSTIVKMDIGKKVVQKEACAIVDLRESVPAVQVIVEPFCSDDMANAVVTLRDFRIYHMPYVITDTFDNALDIPSLFAY